MIPEDSKRSRDLRSVRHLIWDWNGTLLDDTDLCVEVVGRMLAEIARPAITADHYRERFGFPVVNYYAGLGFDTSSESFQRLSDLFITRYHEQVESCVLHAEAIAFARQWSGAGRRQVILSASRQDHLERTVRTFGIEELFEVLAGTDDIYAAGKSARGAELMRTIGWDRETTLLIGDTDHDAEVARAIGVSCLLVTRGHQSRERLEKTGAFVSASLREAVDQYQLLAED